MALIDFYIRNQKLSKIGPKIIADSVNYVDCSFTFKTDDWNGADKWVTFRKDEEGYSVNLVNDMIPKEAGVNLGAGTWTVYVFGDKENERITTNTVTLEVEGSAVPDGGPLPVMKLTEAEQIAAKAQEALNKAKAVEQAAANGEFDGKPGADVTPEQIEEAVNDYFEENPIPGGGSAEVTAESIKNALGYTPADKEEIPTKFSELENDEQLVDENRLQDYAQPKDDYALKSDIPTVPKKVSELENDAQYAKKSELPTVPTNVSAFNNDAGYAKKTELPTKTSDLNNDSGFITAKDIPAAPEVPVKSVNGKTGAVTLGAEDVGARSNTWMPTAAQVGARPSNWMPTYSDVGAEKAGAVSEHNVSETAHNDIRVELTLLRNELEAFLDIDDPTLDQLSELIQKIEANAGTITELTNGKVNVADIVNNLTTNVANKPLSAAQGVALSGFIQELDVIANGAKTTAEQAKAAAEQAKTDALRAANGAQNAENAVQDFSEELAEMQERMDSGEFNGKNGDSVTVSSVSESTASGGTNTVNFSDGKKLDVKNGKDGKDYVITAQDKQDIKSKIISQIITQEAGESESLVMSQKAVTDLVEEALGTGGGSSDYEEVDSVEEMTDTSKQYVLKETGTLWAYGEVTVEKEAENKFVPSTATLNQRLSGSSGSVSANNSSIGSFVTDFIAVENLDSITPYNMRLNWEMPLSGENKIVYFNSSKTRLGNTVFASSSAPDKNTTISNGETVIDIKTMGSTSTTAPSNWADVAYVRLQLFVKPVDTSLTSADVANLTITFDHEGGITTVNKWYDTGLEPSAGGGGGNYVTLLAKVNKNTSDINEVSRRVTALETGSDTVTVPTFWQNAVDACIAKIKALQKDAGINALTFPFFSDNHQRNGYAGILIKAVMDECHIPYAFFGGDSISNGIIETEAEMIAQDKAFDTVMSYIPNGRFCRTVGNHDGYWLTSAGVKNYYTRAQVYDLFLREEGISQEKHFGADGTYYYVDDIASKVRFIVMNTNTVDDTQLNWVKTVALNITESGWGVVFISHHPICNAYHSNIENAATVVSEITSTAAGKVDIIGWFSGHVHRDRVYTKLLTGGNSSEPGTPTTDLGFTQVVITSDHTNIAYENDDGTVSATKHPIANDDQSHAIDFVTINKATRTVNLTRLGIGEDRSYTY